MWQYLVEGRNAAHGPAYFTPLLFDLAMIIDTFNGKWDRDNVGAARLTSSSTTDSPFASKVSYVQITSLPSAFTLANDGRRYLTNLDQTVTTLDSLLLITGMTSVHINESTVFPVVAGPDIAVLPIEVACGAEVDGRVVYHSGYEMLRLFGNNIAVDINFPRFTVPVPVGAGSHAVRMFLDFVLGTPTNGSDTAADDVQQYESMLLIEEVRR